MNVTTHALPADLADSVARALHEDIGSGDLTAELTPDGRMASATVITREAAIISGTAWVDEVFRQLNPAVVVEWRVKDGDAVRTEQELCSLRGPASAILSGERTALNFLQMMSGVATQTRRLVDRIKGTKTRILDTRKTLPNLRSAQKYAVLCGGGSNHRMGLYDAILIKENHIMAAGNITTAVKMALERFPQIPLIVEVENLAEVEEAIAAGANRLLCDNFPTHTLVRAVQIAQQRRKMNLGDCRLEASGNVSLSNIREIADTGVDFISVGSLTKHVTAIDLSLRFTTQPKA